jgi:hypothetical protein
MERLDPTRIKPLEPLDDLLELCNRCEDMLIGEDGNLYAARDPQALGVRRLEPPRQTVRLTRDQIKLLVEAKYMIPLLVKKISRMEKQLEVFKAMY